MYWWYKNNPIMNHNGTPKYQLMKIHILFSELVWGKPFLYKIRGFKSMYYQAAGQNLTMGFNGIVVCYCNEGPAKLHISCDARLVMHNSQLYAMPPFSVLAFWIITPCRLQD
jgi:hypothetical protein